MMRRRVAKELRVACPRGAQVAVLVALNIVPHWSHSAEPIDTDGPDFVESSEVVGKGRFQFEFDLLRERDHRNTVGERTSAGSLLLRYGVTKDVEARVETEPRVRMDSRTADGRWQNVRAGSGDTALGLKWHSQDRVPSVGTPSVSWIFHLELPTGQAGIGGVGIRPSLRSVITWDLPHDLALGVMPGVRYDSTDDGTRFVSGIFGVVLNRRITDNWRLFVELSSPQIAGTRDGGVLLSFDVGGAYLITNDWQVGARAGFAANRNTPTSTILVELAGRF
jgi:hypothetical protein